MKIKFRKNQGGFTLPELVIVITILSILLGITGMNLIGAQQNTSLETTVDTFIADISQQQVKAMSGKSAGIGGASDYGVYITTNTYTLFYGETYNPSDQNNLTIQLPDNVEFSDALLPYTILFSQVSGEIKNFSDMTNVISIQSTVDDTKKTLVFNIYGIITNIN